MKLLRQLEVQVDAIQSFEASRQVKHFSLHLNKENTFGCGFIRDGLLIALIHSQTFVGFLS